MNATLLASTARRLTLLLLGAVNLTVAQGMERHAADVTATVLGFHAALAAGDAEAATKLLAPDAVVLESGAKETRREYVAHHLHDDIKFAKAVPSARGKVEVVISGDVAWASSTSISQGTYQSKPLNLVNAELMVLTRTATGWEIRAIHWSSRKGK